jgi:hypothetical protein
MCLEKCPGELRNRNPVSISLNSCLYGMFRSQETFSGRPLDPRSIISEDRAGDKCHFNQ